MPGRVSEAAIRPGAPAPRAGLANPLVAINRSDRRESCTLRCRGWQADLGEAGGHCELTTASNVSDVVPCSRFGRRACLP